MLNIPVSCLEDAPIAPANNRMASRNGIVWVCARIESAKVRRRKISRSPEGRMRLKTEEGFQLNVVQNSESIPARSKAASAFRTNSFPVGCESKIMKRAFASREDKQRQWRRIETSPDVRRHVGGALLANLFRSAGVSIAQPARQHFRFQK